MDCNYISKFIHEMGNLRDSLVLPITNLPNQRTLVLRHRDYNDTSIEPQYAYTPIQPLPIIVPEFATINAMEGLRAMRVATGNHEVKGISKNYSREFLTTSGIEYFIDAIFDGTVIKGGFQCELASIKENPLTWNMVLKQRIGDVGMY